MPARKRQRQRTRPDIIISSLDALRLHNRLDAMAPDSFTGRDALVDELARGRMVGPTGIPPNVVTMNCVLEVAISSPRRKRRVLKLVYPEDMKKTADGDSETVSIFSPIGSALIGLSEGQTIDWPKPGGGFMRIKVREILFQPEREGLFQV